MTGVQTCALPICAFMPGTANKNRTSREISTINPGRKNESRKTRGRFMLANNSLCSYQEYTKYGMAPISRHTIPSRSITIGSRRILNVNRRYRRLKPLEFIPRPRSGASGIEGCIRRSSPAASADEVLLLGGGFAVGLQILFLEKCRGIGSVERVHANRLL